VQDPAVLRSRGGGERQVNIPLLFSASHDVGWNWHDHVHLQGTGEAGLASYLPNTGRCPTRTITYRAALKAASAIVSSNTASVSS